MITFVLCNSESGIVNSFYKFIRLFLGEFEDTKKFFRNYLTFNNYILFIFRFKRLASDDEDEMESYRSVVSTPKKAKKANTFHSTQIVPTDQDFRPGDFVVLWDESNQDHVCKSTYLIKITEQIRYTTAIENEWVKN